MTVAIGPEWPDQPDLAPLFAASDVYSASLYPPESNHTAPARELTGPGATFLVARDAGRAVGCGAILWRAPDHAELKRMFVVDAARGRGLGAALLASLERLADAREVPLIRLETGIQSIAALRLYRAAGYIERGPFGAYRSDPLSVFMEKRLWSAAGRAA